MVILQSDFEKTYATMYPKNDGIAFESYRLTNETNLRYFHVDFVNIREKFLDDVLRSLSLFIDDKHPYRDSRFKLTDIEYDIIKDHFIKENSTESIDNVLTGKKYCFWVGNFLYRLFEVNAIKDTQYKIEEYPVQLIGEKETNIFVSVFINTNRLDYNSKVDLSKLVLELADRYFTDIISISTPNYIEYNSVPINSMDINMIIFKDVPKPRYLIDRFMKGYMVNLFYIISSSIKDIKFKDIESILLLDGYDSLYFLDQITEWWDDAIDIDNQSSTLIVR